MACSPATRAALRQVGLGSLKQAQRLDASELCKAIRHAGQRRLDDKPLWEALLYRTAILCSGSQYKPMHIAFTLDALAKVRLHNEEALNFLLAEARRRVHSFKPCPAALLLNSFAKLSFHDEMFSQSLLPPLLRHINEKTRYDNLALLALSCARLDFAGREPVNDRIVAVLTPRIEKVNEGQTLSLLACGFTRPYQQVPRSGAAKQPLFDTDDPLEEEELPSSEGQGTSAGHSGSSQALPHASFVELLLEQCERHVFTFRGGDLVHLCLALANLHRAGREDLVPSRLVKRLDKRLDSLYFELKPAQLVRLLEVLVHIPELEKRCAGKVLSEIAYCARDLTPASCISLLRTAGRIGGHRKVQSAVSWRLATVEGVTDVTPQQVCEVAEAFEKLGPLEWEDREALLVLLQSLHERRREPEPLLLSRLLRAYGEAAVRDTHWHALCKRLAAAGSPSSPTRLSQSATAVTVASPDVFVEDVIANATLALARLSFAQLVDEAALFSRAASWVKSPGPAMKVLEAAALFDLIERRPHDLLPSKLKPLVAIVESPSDTPAADVCKLFPYSDLAAAVCSDARLASMRAASSERYACAPVGTDVFHTSVSSELSSWSGVHFAAPYAVGPLSVPWAVSIEELADYLQHHPLQEGQHGDAAPAPGAARAPGAAALSSGAASHSAEARRSGAGARMHSTVADDAEAGHGSLHGEGAPDPATHILIDLLRPLDFYHTSPGLRGERQRAKGRVLKTARFAELRLLRRMGWRVVCVAHHNWNFPAPGDTLMAVSRANRELIFRLVASLDADEEDEDDVH